MRKMLKGDPANPPRAEGATCFEDHRSFPIYLLQNGVDRFTVQYGLQVDMELTYEQAAAKLGQALMHMLACEGRLDNHERGEDES